MGTKVPKNSAGILKVIGGECIMKPPSPQSVIGQRKPLPFWYSNPYSRPICSRSSTLIGKTVVHWTP